MNWNVTSGCYCKKRQHEWACWLTKAWQPYDALVAENLAAANFTAADVVNVSLLEEIEASGFGAEREVK